MLRTLPIVFSLLAALLLAALPAHAGLADGIEAWKRHDYEAAIKEFRPLAEHGDAQAQAYMGSAYLSGLGGLPRDGAQALNWYRRAADQGNSVGENGIGMLYMLGMGVSQNPAEAVAWFRRSADHGNMASAVDLGLAYQMGSGIAKDPVEAADWFRKAAEKGDVNGAFQFGYAYYNGIGITRDYAQAFTWLQRAAARDQPAAQNMLGNMYEAGIGVTKDYAQALAWHEKAAAQHNVSALFNLGNAYRLGHGVAQDYTKALSYYETSAQAGDPNAQYALGLLYIEGVGAPRDYQIGYFWLTLAAAHLSDETERNNALKARNFAETKLSRDEVDRSQTLARAWRPRPPGSVEASAAPPAFTGPSRRVSTGSGFLVNNAGYVVTDNHVIAGCGEVHVKTPDGEGQPATVVARDEHDDLAALRVDTLVSVPLNFRDGPYVRPGDGVVALGYPLSTVLANEVNVTTGAVSAMAGVGNDGRYLQMSAPVQQGNSGGPLLDMSGNVVGIVTSKLNALALAGRTGDIAQNVNFALKESMIRNFMDANGIVYQTAPSDRDIKAADVGERGTPGTLLVECWRN